MYIKYAHANAQLDHFVKMCLDKNNEERYYCSKKKKELFLYVPKHYQNENFDMVRKLSVSDPK